MERVRDLLRKQLRITMKKWNKNKMKSTERGTEGQRDRGKEKDSFKKRSRESERRKMKSTKKNSWKERSPYKNIGRDSDKGIRKEHWCCRNPCKGYQVKLQVRGC